MNPHRRPTPKEEAWLATFLARPSQPEGTLSLGELRGFLFALTATPDLVKPSEWLPVVFGGDDGAFESMSEAEKAMSLLMPLYNEASNFARNPGGRLPRGCRFREDLGANLEPDAPVSQWSRGFVRGHLWLEETWEAHLSEERFEELAPLLAVLSFFSGRRIAEDLAHEIKGHRDTVEEVAQDFRRLFPGAVAAYAETGMAIWDDLLEAEGRGPVRRAGQAAAAGPVGRDGAALGAVGRNDPCPCGSGKKYKKCCDAVSP